MKAARISLFTLSINLIAANACRNLIDRKPLASTYVFQILVLHKL